MTASRVGGHNPICYEGLSPIDINFTIEIFKMEWLSLNA